MSITETRRPVQTNGSAYPDTDNTTIRLNISRTVWNWDAYEIVDQSTYGFTLTVEETQELIAELQKELAELLGN